MMAEKFGLDPRDFKSKAAIRMKAEREAENAAIAMQKDEEKLQNCDSLMVYVNDESVDLDINFFPPFDNWRDANKQEVIAMVAAQLRNGIHSYFSHFAKINIHSLCLFCTFDLMRKNMN